MSRFQLPVRLVIATGFVAVLALAVPDIPAYRENLKEALWSAAARSPESRSSSSDTQRLFKYTDDRGRTHFVSSFEAIPARYQNAAKSDFALPKVKYAEFPSSERNAQEPSSERTTDSGIKPSRRRTGDGEGDNRLSGSESPRFGDGRGRGRPGHGDDDWRRTRWSCENRPEVQPLKFIVDWLCFSRDSLNEASGLLSGGG
jgi:hypothetical protein